MSLRACPAQGGQYVLQTNPVSPSGGSVTDDSGTRNYAYVNGFYGGAGLGHSASCSGTMTWVFVWSLANGPYPASVVLKEVGTAGFLGKTGKCDDGLGDAEVDTPSGSQVSGLSAGTHYQVITGPKQTITVTYTPSAKEDWDGADAASCSVSLGITVTNVGVSFDNVVSPTGDTANQALVGQFEHGSGQAGAYTLSNYQWALSGTAHVEKGAVWNTDPKYSYYYSHDWVPLGASDLTNPTVPFLILSDPDPTPATVVATFTANAVDPNNSNAAVGTVTGKGTVSVTLAPYDLAFDPPGYTTVGHSALLPNNTNPTAMTSSGQRANHISAIYFGFKVNTPTQFSSEGNYPGICGYQQILTGRVDNGNKSFPPVNPPALDDGLPYANLAGAADVSNFYYGDDTPAVNQFASDATTVDYEVDFTGFTIYTPPGSNYGYVPLKDGPWNWHCKTTYDSGTKLWSAPSADVKFPGTYTDYPYGDYAWSIDKTGGTVYDLARSERPERRASPPLRRIAVKRCATRAQRRRK